MWYLYRENSGELHGISVNQYTTIPSIFLQVEDPTVTATDGERIYDGVEVRTATPAEITGFIAFRLEDEKTKTRSSAITSLGKVDDQAGQLLRALALVVLDEVNILRSQHALAPRTANQIKTAIQNKITNKDAD